MAALVLAVGLIAALAIYVMDSQSDSRHVLRRELGQRAALTGQLISGALFANSTPAKLLEPFGGAASTLDERARAESAGTQPSQPIAVLDARGRLIGASDDDLRRAAADIARRPDVRSALAGRQAISDVFTWRGTPIIEIAVPFQTRQGRRVAVIGAATSLIDGFSSGFLSGATAVRGAHAYLIDGNGRLLARGNGSLATARIDDRALDRAARSARSGSYTGHTFVSMPVPRSRWRVVFSVPSSALYASVNGTRRSSWALFGAFAVSILALLALAAAALRGARRMATLREQEETARVLAHERLHDALTGLPNRSLFLDRVEHAMAALPRQHAALAVLFIDVDRFKRINDSLGHTGGDAVLREVARRLQDAVRPGDTVSRFGGDEFVALCVDLSHEETAARIARRIGALLDAPIALEGREMAISASIGIAVYAPGDRPVSPGDLIRDADVAMYRAKQRGGDGVEVFDARLQREALARLDAEVALRGAIGRDELVVHYQPIVRLDDRSIRGAEALVRWRRDGDELLVPPGEFVPLAEETGMIVAIGEHVLRQAVRQVGEWAEQGVVPHDFTLFVNLSARQLADAQLPEVVRGALAGWSLLPRQLCLELTESAVAADAEVASHMLARLDQLGVRLAIDDFGVGHSSLGQLSRALPISVIKLDRSFVASMETSRDRGIVVAAAALARALDVTSVAEGVESPDQAGELREMGFTYAQGFHFGRPAAAEVLLRLLLPAANR